LKRHGKEVKRKIKDVEVEKTKRICRGSTWQLGAKPSFPSVETECMPI
jgi:hypothetical protein